VAGGPPYRPAQALTEPFGLVATLEDGRVVRLEEYFDRAAALASVGL
jgi:ketosteroid isomerase-like protein